MHAPVRLRLRILRQELPDQRPYLYIHIGKLEPGRHHPHDGEAAAVERDRLPQNIGIAAEARDPEPVAQEGERRALVGGGEPTTDLGTGREHGQQVGRDRRGLDLARVSGTGEVVALRGRGPDTREVVRQRAQVVQVRKRDAEPHALEPRGHNLHEPVRFRVRQRPEQHAVNGAEDGRVGADAEGEGEDGDGREGGALGERTDGVAQVLEQRLHVRLPRFGVRGPRFPSYSDRSATIGSTLVARRAGHHVAASATATSSTAVAAKVTASLGATSKSRDLRTRVTPKAPARPSATPSRTRRRFSRSSNPTTWLG